MKRRTMGLGLLAGLSVMTGALTACSGGGGGDGGDRVAEYGTLSVPLSTVGASGTEYRLRNAVFEISDTYRYYPYDYAYASAGGSGSQTITVSSEDHLDDSAIAVSLERGYYYVTLQPGWHLEKLEGGVATEVESTLLSDALQFVYVSPHSTSWLEYQFGLGDRKLWFNGKLNIDVHVYEKPSEIYGDGGYGAGGYGNVGGEPSYGGAG